MKKYLVRYNTKDGDYEKEWCHANSELEAKRIVQDEHWNIAEVTSVTEL